MGSIFLRDAMEFGTIKLHRVELTLAGIVFVAGEINQAGSLIHAIDAEHLEITLSERTFQLGVGSEWVCLVKAVEIKLGGSIAPAGPEETVSRLQDGHVVVHVDPRVGDGFGEHSMRAPGMGIDEIEVKVVLGAIQYFRPEDAIIDPSEAGDVNLRVLS